MIRTPALTAERYADWIVGLVPGAQELRDEYEATLPAVEDAKVAVRDRIREGTALRETQPHSHEIEDTSRQTAASQRALDAAEKASERARIRFERAVDAGRSTDAIRIEAAQRALEYHARADAAMTELEATIDRVDAAWVLAGQPGRSWRANTFGESGDAQRLALLALRQRVDGFDVQRVTEAASGAEVEPELHGNALVRKLAAQVKGSGPILLAS
ncbi:hypothetical protein C5C18_07305 [Rathayibacter tritici]|uniref:hypothetical protein n=1 Tax=Rathayibacter tritici TaxID=33888 RepID=UPI000CE72BCF|nr:hypothetical protein [Rathayibacter tritici]PPF29994.1 hypothetical protein C5C06_05835 [Rathayibacter tritici]PPF68691.1 hypothetical protein C5C21_04755 [Rathayibacter tritici]PPG07343.1 hypothetical protein C5C18_07305 [Rathayibacter tritici]PPI11959.1 hypothetical protein C5D07_13270 [Rathayibacter tritici]